MVLRGSQNGPVIERGSAEKSLLYQRVKTGIMPPGKEKLSGAEIDVIREWIDSGALSQKPPAVEAPATAEYQSQITAEDRKFWVFRPLANPPVPASGQKLNPVDAFLLQKLREKQLTFTKPAKKTVLIRRAYLDLAPRRHPARHAAVWRALGPLLARPRRICRHGRP
jgi:hypothetical protein